MKTTFKHLATALIALRSLVRAAPVAQMQPVEPGNIIGELDCSTPNHSSCNNYEIISGSSHVDQRRQSVASGGLLGGVIGAAGSLANNAFELAGTVVHGATDEVTSLGNNALGTAANAAGGAVKGVTSLVQNAIPNNSRVGQRRQSMASGGPLDGIDITSLGNDPLEAANAAANAVNGVTSLVQDAIRNYYNIISGSSHLGQSGQSMASGGLLDGIVRGAGSLVNNTLGAVGAAVNGATDGVTSLVSNALGTAGTVVNGATNEVASLAQSGIPGVAATVNSVAGAATADATSAVVSLAQNVVSGVDQLA